MRVAGQRPVATEFTDHQGVGRVEIELAGHHVGLVEQFIVGIVMRDDESAAGRDAPVQANHFAR